MDPIENGDIPDCYVSLPEGSFFIIKYANVSVMKITNGRGFEICFLERVSFIFLSKITW